MNYHDLLGENKLNSILQNTIIHPSIQSEVKIRKKWGNSKRQQKPHEDILQSLGDDRRRLCRPSWPHERGADRRHVELHSCRIPHQNTNKISLATLHKAKAPTAAIERATAHEPMDPSSGNSAGGDITSSLIDASMACGNRGGGISSNRWCATPKREWEPQRVVRVDGLRTVSPRRTRAEP